MKYIFSKQVETILKETEDNLDKGKNSQFFESFNKAIEKVMTNPTSQDFLKYDLQEYRAVDVLAQRRAFFKIYKEFETVFFVWVNPSDMLHDSSKGELDPCYRAFKRLLDNEKLEVYSPQPVEEPEFNFFGKFRRDKYIHINLKSSTSFSQADLELVSKNESEYEINNIYEKNYYSDSLPILLKKVAMKAKEERVNLVSIVGLERDQDFRASVTRALLQVGFELVDTTDIGEKYSLAS